MIRYCSLFVSFFFFNDTATTEIYTLSLHDALPIWTGTELEEEERRDDGGQVRVDDRAEGAGKAVFDRAADGLAVARSEEHTSELQSQSNLVCRLLLEKKKKKKQKTKAYQITRRACQ